MEEAADLLKKAQRILITTHVNPDGDAIGASLALYAYLKEQGKETAVFIDDDLPRNLSFLPNYAAVRRPDGKDWAPELLVVLDTDPERIGAVINCAPKAKMLNIDHHIANNEQADYLYLAKRSATAEMIFEILEHLGAAFSLSIALPLYTGLVTDTGFFRYSNTTPLTMRAGGQMLEAGVEPHMVSEALEVRSLASMKGQAAALERMELFAAGKAAGMFLEKEFVDKLDSTEGFIDLIRVIESVEVAVLVKCVEEGICRVSMRSKGVDVNAVAMQFGGGGHIRAAGCTLKMTLAEAKAALLPAITAAVAQQS